MELCEMIESMTRGGRVVSFRFVNETHIATAIPLKFNGGFIPEDWRAKSSSFDEAIDDLFNSHEETPSDFNWYDDDGNEIPGASC